MYDVKTSIVNKMSYQDFLEFIEDKTGVVFIGDDSEEAKTLADIFCETLCECDVDKAHFVKKSEITDDILLEKFEVKELNYPIIVSYKNGILVGYYDSKTETKNIKNYLDDLIHEAYPQVCEEVC